MARQIAAAERKSRTGPCALQLWWGERGGGGGGVGGGEPGGLVMSLPPYTLDGAV